MPGGAKRLEASPASKSSPKETELPMKLHQEGAATLSGSSLPRQDGNVRDKLDDSPSAKVCDRRVLADRVTPSSLRGSLETAKTEEVLALEEVEGRDDCAALF